MGTGGNGWERANFRNNAMKKQTNPELAQTINRQAHMLAAQSFASIRLKLEERARALLRSGASLEDTPREIRAAGVQSEGLG